MFRNMKTNCHKNRPTNCHVKGSSIIQEMSNSFKTLKKKPHREATFYLMQILYIITKFVFKGTSIFRPTIILSLYYIRCIVDQERSLATQATNMLNVKQSYIGKEHFKKRLSLSAASNLYCLRLRFSIFGLCLFNNFIDIRLTSLTEPSKSWRQNKTYSLRERIINE